MNRETHTAPTPERSPKSPETAWLVFQAWTGSDDPEWFNAAYLGYWPDRASFGLHLAARFGADARLRRLPPWMQPYVQLNGERITADFVGAGHFHITDVPGDSGCHVFDTYS